MKVDFIEVMGSDVTVANAARVSFNKQVKKFGENEERLINFLARNNHWTPFAHCFLSIKVKAPIFVARQLAKHQIGLVWNEVSRRYVDYEPEFYYPEAWRARAEDKKQGSAGDLPFQEYPSFKFREAVKAAHSAYECLLAEGVCPEQARIVLPQAMYTEWWWSGSLVAFARVVGLRCKEDTQRETRIIADQIREILFDKFPISAKALCK